MKSTFVFFLFSGFLSASALHAAPRELSLDSNARNGKAVPFLSRGNPPNPALAMNLPNEPYARLRASLERELGYSLEFFKKWNPSGEAHVTVITPVEYVVLQRRLPIERIEAIALRYSIQKSDIRVLGLGSARKTVNAREEETFFVIIESLILRWIRNAIHTEFVRLGGAPGAFDPSWFFPHVTVGTRNVNGDLHENHGVLKNLKFSLDPRFHLRVRQ